MRDAVDQIKSRLSIVDVVSSYVELHQAGKSMKGKSPFTNEKTASFYVSPDQGLYYCFSSNQGGDMFTFVEKMEGVDFKGALTILAERAGVTLEPLSGGTDKSARDRSYQILTEATHFFSHTLLANEEAKKYLKERGVTDTTVDRFSLGYAPGPPQGGWRELRSHLKGKGYTDEEIHKAGLVKSLEGKEPYDVFRDRIMFPIRDASGRVVAFSGRILHPSDQAPKYVNSPETDLYRKSEILFGYDMARQGIRHYDFSLIVEGQFDLVHAHQAGYTNTVAVSGTALTSRHVELIGRLSNKAVLALDTDRAGVRAMQKASEVMLSRGMDVKVAKMEGGKDPADMLMGGEVEGFKKAIRESLHIIEFLLSYIEEETPDPRSYKLRVREEVLPFLLLLPNRIDQEHFEGIVSEKTDSSREAVHHEVERLRSKKDQVILRNTKLREGAKKDSQHVLAAEGGVESRLEALHRHLAAMAVLIDETHKADCMTLFSRITGEDPQNVFDALNVTRKGKIIFDIEKLLSEWPPHTMIMELHFAFEEFNQLTLKQEIVGLRKRLQAAEDEHDEQAAEEILKELNRLQKKLGEPITTGTTLSREAV